MIKNAIGASLIEAMVAIGLMSIVTLGMANMMSNMSRQIQQLETKIGVNNAKGEVMTSIQSQNVCTRLLQGQTLNVGSPLVIGDYRKGAKVGSRLEVYDVVVNNVTTVDAPTNSYSASISVQFVDTVDTNISYKPLDFVLYYTTAGGTISTCGNSGTLENLQASCSSLGATWDSTSNSCEISSSVCASFGGTYVPASGGNPSSCDGLGDPPPSLASCNSTTTPASDSTVTPYSENGACTRYGPCPDRGRCRGPCVRWAQINYNKSGCRLPSGTNSSVVSGTCTGSGARGGCQYQCFDGSWTRVSNTCVSQ